MLLLYLNLLTNHNTFNSSRARNHSPNQYYLVPGFPRVSSRSSETHSSCILSPSHGFTNPNFTFPPKANSVSDIGTSAVLPVTAGEHVPLCPGVQIRPLNGWWWFATRLNVGEDGPSCGVWTPESHPESGGVWMPGLWGVEEKGQGGGIVWS